MANRLAVSTKIKNTCSLNLAPKLWRKLSFRNKHHRILRYIFMSMSMSVLYLFIYLSSIYLQTHPHTCFFEHCLLNQDTGNNHVASDTSSPKMVAHPCRMSLMYHWVRFSLNKWHSYEKTPVIIYNSRWKFFFFIKYLYCPYLYWYDFAFVYKI